MSFNEASINGALVKPMGVASPVATAITAKDKGSLGNRTNYLAEQTKENFKTTLKQDVVALGGVAATGVATIATARSKALQNAITNVGKRVMSAKVATDLKNFLSPAAGLVKALPKPAKAVLAAGLIATTAIITNIQNKHLIKTGQIDQKYTDKAKAEKLLA